MTTNIDSVDGLLIFSSSPINQEPQLLFAERMNTLQQIAHEEEKKRSDLILKRTFKESEFTFSRFGATQIIKSPVVLQFSSKRPIEEVFKIKGYANLEREFVRDFGISREEKKSKESNEKLINFEEFLDTKTPLYKYLSSQKLREIIIDSSSFLSGNAVNIFTKNEIKERAKLIAGISKTAGKDTIEENKVNLESISKEEQKLKLAQLNKDLERLLISIGRNLDQKMTESFNSGKEDEAIKLKKVKNELENMKKSESQDKETFYKTLKLFAISNSLL